MASTIVRREKTKKEMRIRKAAQNCYYHKTQQVVKMTTSGIQDKLGLLVHKQKKLEVSFHNSIKFKH